MIAIATNTNFNYGAEIQTGVWGYASTHDPKRWADVMALPTRRLERGRVTQANIEGWVVEVTDTRVRSQVLAMKVAAVNVAAALKRPGVPTVNVDDRQVGRTAAQYFLNRGYRHCAYLRCVQANSGDPKAYGELRGRGFAEVIVGAGYPVSWYGDFPKNPPAGAVCGRGAMIDWIKALPKPAAIFASHDMNAAQVHAAATAATLNVPEQVAILGVDNNPNMHFGNLGISSIELPLEDIGYEAAKILDGLLDGRRPERMLTCLPPGRIITRTSTDARAINDTLVLEALRFIRESACRGARVEDVVNAVPASRRSLQRRFAEVLGTTINHELTRIRVANAIKLLGGTSLAVAAVAEACGFGDRNQFTIAFRAVTGRTPRDFRLHGKSAAMYRR